MNFFGSEQRQKRNEYKRSLAMDDPRVRDAAGMLALGGIVDIDTLSFNAAIENLALVRERYDLDPDEVAGMLLEFQPELALGVAIK